MTSRKPPLALRASVIAVHGALAVFASVGIAHAADDPAVAELTKPTNNVEIGVIYVDEGSAKFGEYNGLDDKGARLNANVDIRGGAGYERDSGSTQRWRIFGNNLGTNARSLGGEYSHQGSYRIRFDYDELERNFSDTYRSLWRGVGTTTLVLPAGYPAASARTGTAGLANWNNVQTPFATGTTGQGPGVLIPALSQQADIGTIRKKLGLGGEVNLTDKLSVSLNARQERKDGTKLTGMAFGGFRGALLAEPIDSETTIAEAQMRYTFSKDAQVGVGYNVSRYRNSVDTFTAENPFANNVTINNRIMGNGAPDNTMHQWTLDGSWRFMPTLKLVVAGSRSTMKQDEPFYYQSVAGWSVPGAASNSRETQTNLVARLTANPMKDLDINAAYKLDHRDNRSPIRTYVVGVQGDNTATPSAGTTFSNVPLNRKQQTLSLDGRYNIAPAQSVTAGYEHIRIERTADSRNHPTSDELSNPFASARADEDVFKLGYRHAFSDAVTGQVTYQHGRRKAHDYEEPTVNAPGSSANVGFFSEVPGFRQFFLNDRNRDKLRATVDVQASEQVFLQAGVDYIEDRFPAAYGVKKTGSQAFNLDGTYTASEKLSFNGFVSYETAKTRVENYQIPVARVATNPAPTTPHAAGTCAPYSNAAALPTDYLTDSCRQYSYQQGDNVWTVGLGAKSTQFLGGKLTLTADVSYSRAKTNIDFTGGTYYSNGVSQNVYVLAQNMPAITSTMTDFRLGAVYSFSKQSAVKFGWQHRRLRSSDPQFDLFGITAVQAYIGPGMTSPNYSVNAVSVTYVHSFR
ncbi:MtrB/PioB family decaheme-associated outer membrane protein [Ramlibacter albus]|uniref:MtrB/PioB family decaheme-associated outer membrane protein n=1 Tax=Ramlibacter albus TaxID=2079448 RepID=A0A923M5S5_9BURK|nr:MtrB/PioB family decaheme-associated outer membrane protein [Ramlibacter albus]MBC5764475.1 MtrB/PioB family decaheme-associated outer membrane protein [Ramlibacter albus]